MKEIIKISIKSSLYNRKRTLTFHQYYIEFDENAFKFNKENISGFKFGVKWINGYSFTFGRIYCIDIINNEGIVIKIRLKSIYKINIKLLTEKYFKIISLLEEYYFDDISRKHLENFSNEIPFKINDIEFTKDGISFNNKFIFWEDLLTKSYTNYYSLSSKSNSSVYVLTDYMNDWNGAVLYSVTRMILKSKELL